eukprot:4099734-Amphidinium_carterae.1
MELFEHIVRLTLRVVASPTGKAEMLRRPCCVSIQVELGVVATVLRNLDMPSLLKIPRQQIQTYM